MIIKIPKKFYNMKFNWIIDVDKTFLVEKMKIDLQKKKLELLIDYLKSNAKEGSK